MAGTDPLNAGSYPGAPTGEGSGGGGCGPSAGRSPAIILLALLLVAAGALRLTRCSASGLR